MGIALAFLVGVVASEEMPRNCRAYAVSVLAMAAGFGAGVAVVLGAVLFIYAVAFPRREIVTPGPLESDRLSHDPDHMAAE